MTTVASGSVSVGMAVLNLDRHLRLEMISMFPDSKIEIVFDVWLCTIDSKVEMDFDVLGMQSPIPKSGWIVIWGRQTRFQSRNAFRLFEYPIP